MDYLPESMSVIDRLMTEKYITYRQYIYVATDDILLESAAQYLYCAQYKQYSMYWNSCTYT